MLTYVLEASSLLRFIDVEDGADRVAKIFAAQAAGTARVVICAVNWGEVIFVLRRKKKEPRAERLREEFAGRLEIVAATAERGEGAAEAHLRYKIPYADCFALQLAASLAGSTLVTADFDYVSAAQDLAIEFLPPKVKP